MVVAFGLAVCGLLLIYFEFFVPGGILGVLGATFLLGSLTLFTIEKGSLFWALVYILTVAVLLVLTIRFALWKIRRKPSMYAADEQSGYVASRYDQKLIGKVGIVVTNLKPSGHIEIEGEQYQAVSESSYIKKGETIKIISAVGARYKVRIHHDRS